MEISGMKVGTVSPPKKKEHNTTDNYNYNCTTKIYVPQIQRDRASKYNYNLAPVCTTQTVLWTSY